MRALSALSVSVLRRLSALVLLAALLLPAAAVGTEPGGDGSVPEAPGVTEPAAPPVTVEPLEPLSLLLDRDGALVLPETVTVRYSTGAVEEAVVWTEEEVQAVDVTQVGTYVLHGTVTLSQPTGTGETALEAVCTVTVREPDLLAAWLPDPEGCILTGEGLSLEEDGGLYWSASGYAGVRYPALSLPAGVYTLEIAPSGAEEDCLLQVLDSAGAVLAAGAPETAETAEPEAQDGDAEREALTEDETGEAQVEDAEDETGEAQVEDAEDETGEAQVEDAADGTMPVRTAVTFSLSEASEVSFAVSFTRSGAGGMVRPYLHRHETVLCQPQGDGTHLLSCADCAAELLTEPCGFLPQSMQDCSETHSAALLFACRCGETRQSPLGGDLSGLPDQIELLADGSVSLVSRFQADETAPEDTAHVTYSITYASGDESVLSVASDGTLTALRAGETVLSCRVYGKLVTETERLTCLVLEREIPVTVLAVEETAAYTVTAQADWEPETAAEEPPSLTPDGSGVYAAGETAVLTAQEAEGMEFLGWYDSEGVLLTHEAEYEVPVTQDLMCRAVYRPLEEETLTAAALPAEEEPSAAAPEAAPAPAAAAAETAQAPQPDTAPDAGTTAPSTLPVVPALLALAGAAAAVLLRTRRGGRRR